MTASKGGLIGQALKRIAALPPEGQDAIASLILKTLDSQADQAVLRFQFLVEQKYIRGLTTPESAELRGLEAGFRESDEQFYAPVLERIAHAKTQRKSSMKAR